MRNELFKNIPRKVGDLVKDVRNGRIGLPDLQRPFVWRDNKVRELFDSMLKGYPIGYIMLWESPVDYESKKSTIGDNSKTYEEPKELVIDGQQRLTALVAAMFAVKVKDKNFADREIKISYNPLTREFAVWSQAYEKDTEWISRISDVFLAKEDNSISSLRRHFIKEANEGRSKKELPLLTDEEEDRIEDNINALLNLSDYSLPTLEISYTADEEDVADIFVRVNSGGQSLTENNFIQTLISVYENETSNKINAFAAASRVPAANTSYNTLLAIEPSHLIRMAVGVGFKRARLRYAYMLLRGKNLETGKFSDEVRHENLQIFKDALDKVMNLNNWHSFINIVAEAGYISDKLIASSNAMRKETFTDCVRSALSTGIWSYTDSKITEGDRIDGAFPTPVKFIAENDPTGSYYNNVIPLEKSLYGSTFQGNYYVFEIYARGEHLKDLLRDKDVNVHPPAKPQCERGSAAAGACEEHRRRQAHQRSAAVGTEAP